MGIRYVGNMKTCYKCKIEKSLESFHKDKSRKDGLHTECKDCTKAYGKAYYADPLNKKKIKIYRDSRKGELKRKPNGYWTKKTCKAEALKYETRTEFRSGNSMACQVACKMGWMNEICVHMKRFMKLKRLIYAVEFQGKYVYVGLTGDLKVRKYQHLNRVNEAVFKHIQKTGMKPIYKTLTSYLPIEEAQKQEAYFQEKYKNEGWKPLHSAKAGALGGSVVKWTKEIILADSKKYKTITAWDSANSGCYQAACRMGLSNEATSHMSHGGIKYNEELVVAELKKYERLIDFREDHPYMHRQCYHFDWFKKNSSHLVRGETNKEYKRKYSDEFCHSTALKYSSKSQFQREDRAVYQSARKRDKEFFNKICSHMTRPVIHNKGKKHSKETRKKISIALKKRCAAKQINLNSI